MRDGTASSLALVRGDLALAMPEAERFVAALAGEWKVEPVRSRRPEELSALVEDLRTYSMFEPGKIVVAVATGVLADRDAASELLAEALGASFQEGGELEGSARDAALRLLQVIRLHDLDPAGGTAEEVLAALPNKLFGTRKAGEAEKARASLAPLLSAAVSSGLTGVGETTASLLADLLRDGLPERHLLVLVESAVASSHPLLAALERRKSVANAGRLESARGGGVAGLERLVEELEQETGVSIAADAAAELARRTLKPEDVRRGGEANAIDAESVARFGAEYRKLAGLAGGKLVRRALVEANVDDRGQEEVWPILDAVGDGQAGTALAAIARRLRGADDPLVERLSLFALLAGFARDMILMRGLMAATGVPSDVDSYPRFKSHIAPKLKAKVEGVAANPFARTHEFRMHKVYRAAARRADGDLARLPAKLLETERRIKGDADDPDAALALLVIELARTEGRKSPPAGRRRLRER